MTIKDTIAEGYRYEHYLISIGFSTPVYLTDADIPIIYGGHTYMPGSVETVTVPMEASGGPCKVIISDDGSLDDLELAEDASGLVLTVSRIYNLDTSLVELLWSGLIDEWQASDRAKVSISGAVWGLFHDGPAVPLLTDQCIHSKFGGPGCAYSGSAAECDGALSTCQSLGNSARFVSAYWAPIPGTVVWVQGQRYTVPVGGSPGNVGTVSTSGETTLTAPPAPPTQVIPPDSIAMS